MHVPAKVEYGMRALLELAGSPDPLTGEALARAQGLPPKFLASILNDLRRAGLVHSQRGMEGGYRLGRPAGEITAADVMRALDGPLAEVRGLRPEMTSYDGAAARLKDLWVATRASLRAVLERVTLEDMVKGELPAPIAELVADPDSWVSRVR